MKSYFLPQICDLRVYDNIFFAFEMQMLTIFEEIAINFSILEMIISLRAK